VEHKVISLNPLRVSLGEIPISPAASPRLLVVIIGWLAGIAAILSGCGSNSASNPPTPIPTVTSVSTEDIQSYARAVLSIDINRKTAYEEIQKMTRNERVPDVTCTEAKSITALSKDIQGIAVNYCQRSKKSIENEGLTTGKFNAITVSAQSNPELQQRIQSELVRLQPN
jgi:hypothetical protein